MLNKNQIWELRNAVDRVDLAKAIKDAKDMGIKVTKKKSGYHGIYNTSGTLEKINIDHHFRINNTIGMTEINKNTKNETFSYTYEVEKSNKASGIETETKDMALVELRLDIPLMDFTRN